MRTACSTQRQLMTGSMPGMAASTNETWVLGSAPNAVDAPENSLAFEMAWAWTSRPMMTSHGPLAPSSKPALTRRLRRGDG